MLKKLLLTVAVVAGVGWAVLIAVLLVEIRNDSDDTADAILLRDGDIAGGIWLAVHSSHRPVLVDGTIHHTAPAAPAARAATTTTAAAPATTSTVRRTTTSTRCLPPLTGHLD